MQDEGLRTGDTIMEIDSGHGGSWLPRFADAGLVERGPDSSADLVVDLHGLLHEADLVRPWPRMLRGWRPVAG
jgi:hypothetical protein